MTEVQDYQSLPNHGDHKEDKHTDVEKGVAEEITHPIDRVPTYLQPSMPLRERLNHFTFAWYTLT
jgi:hypothetical protein